jgi:hypothetical protein
MTSPLTNIKSTIMYNSVPRSTYFLCWVDIQLHERRTTKKNQDPLLNTTVHYAPPAPRLLWLLHSPPMRNIRMEWIIFAWLVCNKAKNILLMNNLQPDQLLLYGAESGVGVDTITAGIWKALFGFKLPWVALERMQCLEARNEEGQVCGESAEVIFSIRFLCPLLPGSYIWQHSSQEGGTQASSRDSVVSSRFMLRTKMVPSVCF